MTGRGRLNPHDPAAQAIRAARLEDYLECIGQGDTPEMAAQRVGVSVRTIERYLAAASAEVAA